MEINKIRNVAFISHGGAGMTKLLEAMLYNTGTAKEVTQGGGNIMDYDPVEVSRGLSINAKVATINYNEYQLNLIDTPGYANFLHDTKAALSAVSGAVVLASAITGIKAETERVWHFADEYSLSRLVFINKMDKERADFFLAVADIEKTFHIKPLLLQLPIGAADTFTGVIDLIKMKALIFNEDGTHKEADIPADLKASAEKYRMELVEAASETDDALIEKYLETGNLSDEEIVKGLREGVVTKQIVPVLCGSAKQNISVQPLFNAIIDYLPSPVDEAPQIAVDKKNYEEIFIDSHYPGFSAYVFKTIIDPFAGKMSFFRVFSGSIKADQEILNSTKDEREKITQLSLMQGKNTVKVDEVFAGQIGMASKLRHTSTFDTLSSINTPVEFPKVEMPEPVISFSIAPKSKDDDDKVSNALQKLLEEDPGLHLNRDPETAELLLSGMGQMHIEAVIEKLQKKFNVQVVMNTPKVPYRETIKGTASGQGKYKKQSGGRGQYGDVWLEISPLERGAGFQFEDKIVGGVVPKNYIPAVEKGIREAMLTGVLSGYPMVDFKITLYDGSYHSVDSSEMAFKVAASMAYKAVATDAKPIILEPIMDLDIFVPEEYVGAVIGDINARRGRILNVEPQTRGQHIRAQAPMAEVLSYAPDLRSTTGGHGLFTMAFAFYEELPSHLVDGLIKKEK